MNTEQTTETFLAKIGKEKLDKRTLELFYEIGYQLEKEFLVPDLVLMDQQEPEFTNEDCKKFGSLLKDIYFSLKYDEGTLITIDDQQL